jgi:hypothetical protein
LSIDNKTTHSRQFTGPKAHNVGYGPFLIAVADEFELDGIGVRNIEVQGKHARKGYSGQMSIQ